MAETKQMNLMQKLAKARVMLQKRNLKKSGQNKFAGFRYFELADFLPSVNEIFDELGLYAEFCITPTETEKYDGIDQIVTVPPVACLTIYDAENPTVSPRRFSSDIADAGTKGASPIQQLGSVHTYMRRYLYMEALEIVESDALDAVVGSEKVTPAESSAKPKSAPKQAKTAPQKKVEIQLASPIQIERMKELFAGHEDRLQGMMSTYRISKLEELTATQAMSVIKRMEETK